MQIFQYQDITMSDYVTVLFSFPDQTYSYITLHSFSGQAPVNNHSIVHALNNLNC